MFELHHRYSYSAKEEIKALGGVWKSKRRCWELPTEEAWQAAYRLCDIHGPNNIVEDYEAYEESYRGQGVLPPILLKDQSPEQVKSGQIFAGVGYDSRQLRERWIVCCQLPEHPLADAGDFACVNLRTGGMRFLNPSRIAGYAWHEQDLNLAKAAWKEFVEARAA